MKGKLLTQDDHVKALVTDDLISYNLTSSALKEVIREEENYEKQQLASLHSSADTKEMWQRLITNILATDTLERVQVAAKMFVINI
jgi:hypothetical protein